jgi:tetratricopeptide (TPR) repeat protein
LIVLELSRSITQVRRVWTWSILSGVLVQAAVALATPYTPASDAQVLAEVPPGSAHTSVMTRDLARSRADVALPLAQFYIARSRATGDLRYLGYAEGELLPWVASPSSVQPMALVLQATILQSRHSFGAALVELDRALAIQPNNAQGWLTRATILRVLGRYQEATLSCGRLAPEAESTLVRLCEQSLRALTGHLEEAYAEVESIPPAALPPLVQMWRDSELAEMAERLGQDTAAERWFREGLHVAPEDFYMRAAYADLLLRHHRAAETLQLLSGYDSVEPLLLRIVIARRTLGDTDTGPARARLESAFALEEQRGESVHRREQARFFLEVEGRPDASLAAALENWRVQREPDDLLILLRAAHDAGRTNAAKAALDFLAEERLQDARLEPYIESARR